MTAQYIHGAGLGADVGSLLIKQELVDDDENGTFDSVDTTYFYSNHRGDVIDTADENGDISASYRYEAFGQTISSLTPEWGFSSKRFDTAISLSYFGARYYDASIGRFISRDPMEYIDGPNQYIYCANNPMLWIDPFGLCTKRGSLWDSFKDRTKELLYNFIDYNHRSFENSQYGGGTGAKVTAKLGFISVEIGGEELLVNRMTREGWEEDLVSSQKVAVQVLRHKAQFDFENMKFGHSTESDLFSWDNALELSFGGTMPWSSSGAAINGEVHINLKEVVRIDTIFRHRPAYKDK